jgi:3-oxoacyl-[acyl-carrier protein] reductase
VVSSNTGRIHLCGEEIAELMALLVSPGARWMTGSTLRMDGGEVKSI